MKRRTLSPFAVTQLLMAAIIVVALWLAYWPWRWGQLCDQIRNENRAVKYITDIKLQQWLAGRTAPPLLLDLRSEAEFATSHLPSAHRAVMGATLTENGLAGKEKAQVVVYDTVGIDASAFANILLQRGFTDVQVLEGGIFQWANDNLTLVGPGGTIATKVNTGNSAYASMLDGSRRAP